MGAPPPRGEDPGRPPFSHSAGGAPGLSRGRQMHRLRRPHNLRQRGAPCSPGAGDLRAHPHSAHASSAEKLRPPPRRRHLRAGTLGLTAGEGRARPAPPGQASGRRRDGAAAAAGAVVASRAPSHSLAEQPWGRIAFKTSSSPPPGRAGGGRGAGRVRHHVPPDSVRPHFLSAVPQLDLVPNSAPTFSLLARPACVCPRPRPTSRPGPALRGSPLLLREGAGRSGWSGRPVPIAVPNPSCPDLCPQAGRKPRRRQGGRSAGGGQGARPRTPRDWGLRTLTLTSSAPRSLLQPREVPPFIPPSSLLLPRRTF